MDEWEYLTNMCDIKNSNKFEKKKISNVTS